MRATVMPAAHEVRVDNVPDAAIREPTDAVIRITRACICGSDLWPYNDGPNVEGQRMGHEAIGVVEDVGADVHRIRRGQVVIMPFVDSDGACLFCEEACRRLASTAASSAPAQTWTGRRPRRCVFRWPTAHSIRSRSARTTR